MNSSFETGEIAELTFQQIKGLSIQKSVKTTSGKTAYDFLEVVKKFSLSY